MGLKGYTQVHASFLVMVLKPPLFAYTLSMRQKFALATSLHKKIVSIISRLVGMLLSTYSLSSAVSRHTRAKLCHLYKLIDGLADCEMAPLASAESTEIQLQEE